MRGSGWTVEFYDFTKSAVVLDGELAGLGDMHERAARNGARQGTPVLVDGRGRADARVNVFFRTGAMAGARPTTWRRYAYTLVAWLGVLAGVGGVWEVASARGGGACER